MTLSVPGPPASALDSAEAVRSGATSARSLTEQALARISGYAPFGAPWNFAGWPAMTVPAGVHPREGTPLSVQLVAPPGNEARLLGVAAQLEAAAPWQRIAPAYC